MREGRRMWFAIVVSMSLTFVVSHVAYGEYRLSYGDATFGYIVLSMLWVLGGSVIGIAELLFFESWRNSKRGLDPVWWSSELSDLRFMLGFERDRAEVAER